MEGDNWEDLFAVVRSSMSTSKSPSTTTASTGPFSSFPQPHNYQPRPNPFHYYSHPTSPETCRNTRTAMQELEELCKPFLRPKQQYHHLKRPLSSSSTTSSSSSSPQPFFSRHPQPRLPSQPPARTRRRRSQQKRVVREVPADGLSSDVWAWRKYGQKPIKGSPFPRGYYRCSSSKVCVARKQVERSRKDPTMFVITYTGEHSHPVPTHRNSLAGSTRKKSGGSTSVSRFTKSTKTTGEASKVPTSSSSDVTVEEKKGGEGEEQVEQLQVGLLEEEEEEEEEMEEDKGMVLMRELEMEMFREEEILFVGFDEMEASDVGFDI